MVTAAGREVVDATLEACGTPSAVTSTALPEAACEVRVRPVTFAEIAEALASVDVSGLPRGRWQLPPLQRGRLSYCVWKGALETWIVTFAGSCSFSWLHL